MRKNEIHNIQKTIDNCSITSSTINIYGLSGTGKTSLVKEAIEKYFSDETAAVIIYLNLLDDILSTTAFWDTLLFTIWNGNINDKNNMLKIDKNLSLSKYLKRNIYGKKAINILLQSVTSIVATIPVYNAQINVGGIDSNINSPINNTVEIEKSQLVMKYFKYITKKHKLIIIIDNYQFINVTIKHYFESSINQLLKNVAFINIQRTDNNVYISPIAYPKNYINIELTNLNKNDLAKFILEPLYSNISILNLVLEDCYEKTNGNLKEIDLYIRANDNDIKKGI